MLTTNKKAVVKKQEPKIFFVQKTIGADTYLVMAKSAIELEDEFTSLYYTLADGSKLFLMPPFEPVVLLNLVNTNNTLAQCVETMEVNIDGTGHTFVAADDDVTIDKDEEKKAKAFFDEPYPNESFVKIRRRLRRQIESVGYGYLEILRNIAGEVVGLRNIETHNVRMVKLDAPIMVKKTVMRDGKEVQLQMLVRERRFAQRVALSTFVYYREFGVTRNLDYKSGVWEAPGSPVPVENRATELMMFGVHPDVSSPYYLPRWINEMPSVVGSRKAEEQNLQFLDSGGMPNAIIFIQGGVLAKDAADQLRSYLSGQNKDKYRAVVVEAQSSSGTIDSAGSVQVKVERFGAERAQDAMYMKYDASTEEHVRVGFRLPPLFLGKPADYNFASAQTAYMVAEAQVFQPERQEFDEVINKTIIKELGFKTLKIKSNPITLKDVANQMKALELSKGLVGNESWVSEINKATGMDLDKADNMDETGPQGVITQEKHQQNQEMIQSNMESNKLNAKTPGTPQKYVKTALDLIDLAQDYAAMKGLVQKRDMSDDRAACVMQEVGNLSPRDQLAFDNLISIYAFGSDDPDLVQMSRQSRIHLA